jgi:hypothetical protein
VTGSGRSDALFHSDVAFSACMHRWQPATAPAAARSPLDSYIITRGPPPDSVNGTTDSGSGYWGHYRVLSFGYYIVDNADTRYLYAGGALSRAASLPHRPAIKVLWL